VIHAAAVSEYHVASVLVQTPIRLADVTAGKA
jgi:hypothetical protein